MYEHDTHWRYFEALDQHLKNSLPIGDDLYWDEFERQQQEQIWIEKHLRRKTTTKTKEKNND